jgi:hypothetical protein
MPKERHPLIGNPAWVFTQPRVGVQAQYVAVDLESGDREVQGLRIADTCREGVILSIRTMFQNRLTNQKKILDMGWQTHKPKWVATKDCDLLDYKGKKEVSSVLIQWHQSWMKGWEDFPVEKFLRVCDVVLGPVSVLLGPWRPAGDAWWKTDPMKALASHKGQNYIHWNGTDNWFLAHPATAAIATGLYRQCFHLCGAGVADQVIETLSEEEVTEVMSTNSQGLALSLIKKTRPWIEVPVGGNGYKINYAFPFGFWRRLIRLQRAVRRYGYEEALGQSFHEGWGTLGGSDFRGMYSFWGAEGELTDHHKHLMRVGAPKRGSRGK